jgi:GNAT superfamily N-acetyltransferase
VDDLLDALAPARAGSLIEIDAAGGVAVGAGWRPVEAAWYRGVASMARAGLGVIVEEVLLDGGAGQRRVDELLGGIETFWVGVRCRGEVAAAREARRGDRVGGMAADQAVRVHEGVRYDITVDSTSASAEDCAREIVAHLRHTAHSATLATLTLESRSIELRRARVDDIPAIVALLADDPLGSSREHAEALDRYRSAFHVVDGDPSELLVVAVSAGEVVATVQLSFLPGLARGGATRLQLEAVRVREDYRSEGVGRAMIAWAVDEARRRGCALVQLTSDKRRGDAHRFYERLGFVASHEGFKLVL